MAFHEESAFENKRNPQRHCGILWDPTLPSSSAKRFSTRGCWASKTFTRSNKRSSAGRNYRNYHVKPLIEAIKWLTVQRRKVDYIIYKKCELRYLNFGFYKLVVMINYEYYLAIGFMANQTTFGGSRNQQTLLEDITLQAEWVLIWEKPPSFLGAKSKFIPEFF